MRRCLIALACALNCPAAAVAQDVAIMPVIRVTPGPDRSLPVRLQTLRVDVKIVGHLATTTWDMTVYNPQNRVLEGELVFPVGEGQTVSRFAMDVNGRLREGVVVEKDTGRQVFEEIVRRGVDPGLLEKTAGNSFRARVYPIPANGSKRVVIAYEQELAAGGDRASAGLLYHLPLAFTDKVDNFSLRVEVLDQNETPRLQSSPLANFAFKAWQRAYVAEKTQHDVVPGQALTFVVPRGEWDQRVFVSAERGQQYFYVTVSPRLSRQPKPAAQRLLVVWDASASARTRDRAKELQVLDAYVARLGAADVSLAIYRNAMEPVRHGAWAALRQAIEHAPLDGATSPGAIDLSSERADEVLLFTDGVATLGGGEPRLPRCPVISVNSALVAEHAWLRAIAEASGGEYLTLTTTTVKDALQALTTRPLALLRATFDPAEVGEVYPSRGAAIRGPLGLSGRLRTGHAKITLHFGFGGQETSARTIDLDTKESATAPVARIWAQKKLAELELDPTRHADEILALGQQYSIVTRSTSLLVLDRVEDYVRYAVTPPDELRAEYDRRLKDAQVVKARQEQDTLEAVIAQFEERKTWWRTEFKAGPPKDPRAPLTGGGRTEARAADRSEALAVMAPGQAAPSPAMEGAARGVQASKDARGGSAGNREPEMAGSIALKAWSPDTPYLKELKAAAKDQRYARYLALRDEYGATPGFFLDVSDFFRTEGDTSIALRILSNLAELKLEDASLLRVLGYRLRQLGIPKLSVWTFEQVLVLRSEEPQSLRDLALALADAGETSRAVDMLWEVVRRPVGQPLPRHQPHRRRRDERADRNGEGSS